MPKKLKLAAISIIFVITFFVLGIFEYNEDIYATRSIKEKVSFGEKKVRVNCEGAGSPVVIFEPGLNESYTTFMSIQKEISKSVRTFSYDRIALCSASNENKDRSSLNQVEALHQLLKNLKIKGPYIIVAHSIGGFNARLFAAAYPKEVAGIIFIDSSHENQIWNESRIRSNGELNYEEILLSAKQVRDATKKDALRNIPITVLTADYKNREFEAMYEYWLTKQKSIAELSDKSKHIIVENSGHIIQSEHPQAVIDAIKEMISAVRK